MLEEMRIDKFHVRHQVSLSFTLIDELVVAMRRTTTSYSTTFQKHVVSDEEHIATRSSMSCHGK